MRLTVVATSGAAILLKEYRLHQDASGSKIRSDRDAACHLVRVGGTSFVSTSGVIMFMNPLDV